MTVEIGATGPDLDFRRWFVKGLGRITRGKMKRSGREKRRGEAEKDER